MLLKIFLLCIQEHLGLLLVEAAFNTLTLRPHFAMMLLAFVTTPLGALMTAILGLPIRLIIGIMSITGLMGKSHFEPRNQQACTTLLLKQLVRGLPGLLRPKT